MRIAPDWNRDAVAIGCVNPLHFDKCDRKHVDSGSPVAIPSDHDLV